MAHHANPKKGPYCGNICGFCKYMENEVKLKSRSVGGVEYDDKISGRCLAERGTKNVTAGRAACSKFELSYEASRFAK